MRDLILPATWQVRFGSIVLKSHSKSHGGSLTDFFCSNEDYIRHTVLQIQVYPKKSSKGFETTDSRELLFLIDFKNISKFERRPAE